MKLSNLSLFLGVVGATALTSKLNAQITVSINIAPPELPVYVQPMVPAQGYLWIPGYWAYDDMVGYYWVPGYWTLPPAVGYLWTPGYWNFVNGLYVWNRGYWGRRVGYYGGINYGYGYYGNGFYGGRWKGRTYLYNTEVTNVNKTVIKNVYVQKNTYIQNNRNSSTKYSFNGKGGTAAKPSKEDLIVSKSKRISPTKSQTTRAEVAKRDPQMMYYNNKGKISRSDLKSESKETRQATGQMENRPSKMAGQANSREDKQELTGQNSSAKKDLNQNKSGRTSTDRTNNPRINKEKSTQAKSGPRNQASIMRAEKRQSKEFKEQRPNSQKPRVEHRQKQEKSRGKRQ